MNPGDMVYYLYTDEYKNQTKYAATVISLEDDGAVIRVGRFDVHSKEISTFEASVSNDKLEPRSIPCSYEEELTEQAT
jgi:hypothetical protein